MVGPITPPGLGELNIKNFKMGPPSIEEFFPKPVPIVEEKVDDCWWILGLDCRQDILESIFQVCDLQTLKKFRQVCKMWNQEATRALEKKIYIDSGKGSHLALYQTLDGCTYPQYFFTSLQVQLPSTGLSEILKKVLSQYGKHLKELNCSGSLNQTQFKEAIVGTNYHLLPPPEKSTGKAFATIYSDILAKWCPNLRNVKIMSSAQLEDFCPSSFLLENISLSLRKLELDGYAVSTHKTYLLSLLNTCENLRDLKISLGLKYENGKPLWEECKGSLPFLSELKQNPGVVRRLESFALIGVKMPGLTELLSELDYSPERLKSISVCGSTNISDPHFLKVVTFLDKIQHYSSLETLRIFKCTCPKCEWRCWDKSRFREIEQSIPTNEYIKHLEISSNGTYGIGSLEIIGKFPNLEKLEFTLNNVGHENPNRNSGNSKEFLDFDYFFQTWRFLKLTEAFGDPILRAGSKVEELTIHHTLSKLESLSCITECFPSLKKLSLSIRSDILYCWEVYMESKFCLSSTLDGLTELKDLEELSVMMPHGVLYPLQDLSRTLKVLRDLPKLRKFNLTLGAVGDSKKGYFRKMDASEWLLDEGGCKDYAVYEDSHRFSALAINFHGLCRCKLSGDYLTVMAKVLDTYKGNYRFHWCCHHSTQVIAKYGKKKVQLPPIPKIEKKPSKFLFFCD